MISRNKSKMPNESNVKKSTFSAIKFSSRILASFPAALCYFILISSAVFQYVENLQNSFPEVLMNTMSLVTTIGDNKKVSLTYYNQFALFTGFGDVVPKTKLGHFVVICTAIFGMPMMLVCIAKTGKSMQQGLNVLYCKLR